MRHFGMRLGRAVKLLFTNPRDFWVRVKSHVFSAKSGTIKIGAVNFEIDLDLDPVMRGMYFGAYQTEVKKLLEKFLSRGDTFIDVGANIGYISALAANIVGTTGEIHAFEPVPQYFERLELVRTKNPSYHITTNALALGEQTGTAKIAVNNAKNIGWNTMVPNFMSNNNIAQEIEIPVTTLDAYCEQKNISSAQVVKIDTEGYEFPVLKGFAKTLRTWEKLPVIIVEIAPAAYPKLGCKLSDLLELFSSLGYVAQNIELTKQIDVTSLTRTDDIVLLPRNSVKKLDI